MCASPLLGPLAGRATAWAGTLDALQAGGPDMMCTSNTALGPVAPSKCRQTLLLI